MPAISTLRDAEAYLEGLINMEQKPRLVGVRQDLAPIRALLARLSNPEAGLSIIHVAGSKGKGSTCLLAESILRGAGERVGTFTSPHLTSWTERFRIDGREVTGASLAAAVARLQPHVDALREAADVAPTFFDATTAAALLLFADAQLDRVVLEVGLGGRLDSTNAVTPAVTCITSIELEHTDKLGDRIESIAAEKAGILKPGVPCAMGRLPAEAARVVEARAAELGAPLARLGHEIVVEHRAVQVANDAPGFAFRYRDEHGFEVEAQLPSLDAHQVENAALAIAAVRCVSTLPADALAAAVVDGLAGARLPGRCELVRVRPWVVIDGAHTEASALGLAASLGRLPFERLHLVLSVSEGKQLEAILGALLPRAALVTATRAEPHRSLPAAELARRVKEVAPSLAVRVEEDPREAVRRAAAELAEGDLLCISGSIYLAGHARTVLASDTVAGR